MSILDWMRKNAALSNAYAFLSFYKSYFLKDLRETEMKKLFRRVRPYTMGSYERLRNVYQLAQFAESEGLEGAFVECGVWRGGCAGVMAYVSKRYGSARPIHLFDSFEGLPDPSPEDGREASLYMEKVRRGKYAARYRCDAPLEWVEELFFRKLEITQSEVHIHKGWFTETIPLHKGEIDKIAILRLDGDWYESTRVCLDHLYEKVVPGGFVILDDYGYWEGCRKATDEFFKERSINPRMEKIDKCGYFFIKTS